MKQRIDFIRNAFLPLAAAGALAFSLTGCRSSQEFKFDPVLDQYQAVATEIDYPDVHSSPEDNPPVLESQAPATLRNVSQMETWALSLEEAVRLALANSTMIRDVGGRIVDSPFASASVYDVAIQEADPLRGPEAALSAFDAQFATSLLIAQDERTVNNIFIGGGVASFQNNTGRFNAQVSKVAATGTRLSLRNQTDYSHLVNPFNRFNSAYDTVIEGEFRHPLLQGAGIGFNRIAGPNSLPGQYNGVLLARLNTDIVLTQFEQSVRDLVRDVEVGYWNLYFAYRDLEAKIARRDATLQTWRVVKDQLELGSVDGEREALAREQYYAARVAVEDSLSGRADVIGGGVYIAERSLRRLMGVPTNDGRLIRPSEEPMRTDVVFDWNESLTEALWRRSELREQKWAVKQRELELEASSNFLRMRLDLVGQYRWRGFGDNLVGSSGLSNGSAYEDLFGGDLQGWQYGLEMSTPIGNRQGHAAFRHAELQLARERAVLAEQELQIAHDLADAFAELDRAFAVAKSNFNRAIAAQQQVDPIQAKYEAGNVLLENVLDAQSRAADATSAFFRSLAEYSIAVANVHYTRGSLLDYHQVHLAEGPWTEWAHTSALKQARRFREKHHCQELPCPPVSRGPYAQEASDFGHIGQLPSEAGNPQELLPTPAPNPNAPVPGAPPNGAPMPGAPGPGAPAPMPQVPPPAIGTPAAPPVFSPSDNQR